MFALRPCHQSLELSYFTFSFVIHSDFKSTKVANHLKVVFSYFYLIDLSFIFLLYLKYLLVYILDLPHFIKCY